MNDDEAALLAELRAISARSASSRFQDESHPASSTTSGSLSTNTQDKMDNSRDSNVTNENEDPVAPGSSLIENMMPPSSNKESGSRWQVSNVGDAHWQRKTSNSDIEQEILDAVTTHPLSKCGPDLAKEKIVEVATGFVKSSTPFTFQGDRGGAAEDAALLAELKAISAGGASRFSSDEPMESSVQAGMVDVVVEPKSSRTKASPNQRESSEVPPWKRKTNKSVGEAATADIVIAALAPNRGPPSGKESIVEEASGFVKSSTAFTFQGDRGGAADDAALLTELKAISAGGASRFSSDEPMESSVQAGMVDVVDVPMPSRTKASPNQRESSEVPPWKRKTNKSVGEAATADIVISAPAPNRGPPSGKESIVEEASGFVKSSTPFTFQGDRGGAAEDAALLAELKAISAGGASRFSSDEPMESSVQAGMVDVVDVPMPSRTKASPNQRESSEVPPWKRKTNKSVGEAATVDIVIAAPAPNRGPPSGKESIVEEASGFVKSSTPFTFQGDRGGAAEDAALLAELKAISAGGASRFSSDEPMESSVQAGMVDVVDVPMPSRTKASPNQRESSEVPPWKRKTNKSVGEAATADIVISAPAPNRGPPSGKESIVEEASGFVKSSTAFTFQGDRGGAAEDAALLAELKAISAGGASRFSSDEPMESSVQAGMVDVVVEPKSSRTKASPNQRESSEVPPWKRKTNKSVGEAATADIVIAAPAPDRGPPSGKESIAEEASGFVKSSTPFTFQGDRGGAAEDAALLAELKAISAGGASRFSSDEPMESSVQAGMVDVVDVPMPSRTKASPNQRESSEVPPWKRKTNKSVGKAATVDIVIAAPAPNRGPPSGKESIVEEASGFVKSSTPFTFQGDRGGAAENAALLAELKAISAGGASRFSSDEPMESSDQAGMVDVVDEPKSSRRRASPNQRESSEVPPWKRKTNKSVGKAATVDIVIAAPAPNRGPPSGKESIVEEASGFVMSSTPFTFQGDRGGAAEDAALLAELKAISAGGASRFSSDEPMESSVQAGMVDVVDVPMPSRTKASPNQRESLEVPPWKRKTNKSVGEAATVDIVIAAPAPNRGPPSGKESIVEEASGFVMSSTPFTFLGDRGGAAEDAALLAELKAISAGGASRFSSDEPMESSVQAGMVDVVDEPKSSRRRASPNQRESSEVPPWKRKTNKSVGEAATADIVIAAPAPDRGPPSGKESIAEEASGFVKSSTPFTFQGDRGGAAEDAALLAELKAISAGGASRFSSDEPMESSVQAGMVDVVDVPMPSRTKASPNQRESSEVPPWKRKTNKSVGKAATVDIVIAAPAPNRGPPSGKESIVEEASGFVKSSTPFTFQGDRGGAAEDAALLAELKAISAGGASRFSSDEPMESSDQAGMVDVVDEPKSSRRRASPNQRESSEVPPWKRKTNKSVGKAATVDIVIAAPAPNRGPPSGKESIVEEASGFVMSSTPFTFQGDRGGAAEDAALLAELKAISAGGASRFSSDEPMESSVQAGMVDVVDVPMPSRTKASPNQRESLEVPPWKRKTNKSVGEAATVDIVIAAPAPNRGPPSGKESIVEEASGFVMSSTPFTFLGDRGGAAEDAALLAELKAISAGGASRFSSDEPMESSVQAGMVDVVDEPKSSRRRASPNQRESLEVPPWKRKTNKSVGEAATADIVIAAPAPNRGPSSGKESIVEEASGFVMSSTPFTFQGDRGGAAEDAALLAELKAISAGGASRFSSDEPMESSVQAGMVDVVDVPMPSRTKASPNQRESSEVPPWKRKTNKSVGEAATVDIVIAAPAPNRGPPSGKESIVEEASGFVKSSTPFTFQGDRGGAAEDAALLAELKAISAGGASRFSSDEPMESSVQAGMVDVVVEPKSSRTKASPNQRESSEVPPWKRKTNKSVGEAATADIVIAAPASNRGPPSGKESIVEEASGFVKSSTAFTFQGDRGGAAEDAALLAELKAISAGGASRFSSDEPMESSVQAGMVDVVDEPKSSRRRASPNQRESSEVPPWKRKTNKSVGEAATADIVIAAPASNRGPPSGKESIVEEASGFVKSSTAFTFQGDRGGSAEDAALLAELKAISAGGASRFSSDEPMESSVQAGMVDVVDEPKSSRRRASPNQRESSEVPPWKRKTNKSVGEAATADIVIAAPASNRGPPSGKESIVEEASGFVMSSTPFTFQGDRGGAAEDAALLAELKAISAGGASRFSSDEPMESSVQAGMVDVVDEPKSSRRRASPNQRESLEVPPWKRKTNKSVGEAATADIVTAAPLPSRRESMPSKGTIFSEQPSPAVALPPHREEREPEESLVTRLTLPQCVEDKDWKVRKQAYVLLNTVLLEESKKVDVVGSVDPDVVLSGLDDAVVAMVADGNSSALDSALQFALSFAEHCCTATKPELASRIVISLLKGNGFSASKASTVKHASSLALKLMEVGANGALSVSTVVGVLLEKGVTSKKPKIVVNAIQVIHSAALDFGAATLPLAAIKASTPKILQHSNVVVRETGINIIAEICRALGSKSPLEDLLGGLKQAQASQLNTMLESQPHAGVPRVGLRSVASSDKLMSSLDALSALKAQSAEMDAQRFANRPRVNLFSKLATTDYSTRILLPKWSEKVAALDVLLECGGEIPYKLEFPGPSINYVPLIGEMRKLINHTHFAVASKGMQVLSMLAEGVGEKLYPNLRPFVSTLLQLGKDKKLTKAVAFCLDSFFGPVLSIDHLLDKDDSVPSQLDEKNQKNAVVRSSALEYLGRCVKRAADVGKRGQLTAQSTKALCLLAVDKLSDTDAKVRQAALDLLQALLELKDAELHGTVTSVTEGLKTSNARAYKALSSATTVSSRVGAATKSVGSRGTLVSSPNRKAMILSQHTKAAPKAFCPSSSLVQANAETKSLDTAELNDSLARLQALNIPNWSAAEDNGGILAGLKSTQWVYRQCAIQALNAFCRRHAEGAIQTSAVLTVVKNYTKGFKDSNVNIMKSTFELFVTLCEVHAKTSTAFPTWACKDGVAAATDKVADKKLATSATALLTEMCVVNSPTYVINESFEVIERVKSPLVHEAYTKWLNTLLLDFGCRSLQLNIANVIDFLDKECKSANVKVKHASLSVAGELHRQYGPSFRALALSKLSESSGRNQFEATFLANPFDPVASEKVRPRRCLVSNGDEVSGQVDSVATMTLDVPRCDLAGAVSKDCIAKMGSKEGKTAWKLRKEALDEVADALGNITGMLMTTGAEMNTLLELLRAVKERLSDSQSNLKPLAARVIGAILAAVDKSSQGKLGKVVFPSLVGAAMNDSRKPMRDESLQAIKIGTKSNDLDGGEYHDQSLEALVFALVGELKESEFKTAGIPAVLLFLASVAKHVPNIDSIMMARAQPLGESFSTVMVNGLTSSKSETRAAAEILIRAFIDNGTIRSKTVRAGLQHLKPAQQRTVAPIVQKIIDASVTKSPRIETDDAWSERSKPIETNTNPKQGAGSPRPLTRRQPSLRSARTGLGPFVESPRAEVAPPLAFDSMGHPLLASQTAGVHRSRRLCGKQVSWVEYPEEPAGTLLMSTLQSVWSPLIPTEAQCALFPSSGIKKQDDAKDGCELLAKAIEYETEKGGDAVIQQLEFVLKWSAFTLCSRENPVGLHSLLSMLSGLVTFLGSRHRALTDSEALLLFPYVLEKTSNAKGRFRELFEGLVDKVKALHVLPPKMFGAVVCATVFEKSANAKGRVMAYNECAESVGLIGLSGIGKRGLLVVAKMVSGEKLPENRAAALDLMLVILGKMDGDSERLARLCSSQMSDNSRILIEERWQKKFPPSSTPIGSNLQSSSLDGERPGRLSRIPSSRSSIVERRRALQGLTDRSAATHAKMDVSHDHELQRFQLRLQATDSQPRHHKKPEIVPTTGPFTFSYTPTMSIGGSGYQEIAAEETQSISIAAETETNPIHETSNSPPGAAAALRARLIKTRQKNLAREPKPQTSTIGFKQSSHPSMRGDPVTCSTHVEAVGNYASAAGVFEALLASSNVTEDDPNVQLCIVALKRFHTAISENDDMTEGSLREDIKQDVTRFVERLTRVLTFAFDHGAKSENAGMCVPLLSVIFTTLVALFRDVELAPLVSQDALLVLIKATGYCLLDSRLAVAATHLSGLDESTSSQMVRGMNKLAVQAATGSARLTALQALMLLQGQMTLVGAESPTEAAFKGRLSRIAMKLFEKVIKTEESSVTPYSSPDMDFEALLYTMDDMLATAPSVTPRHREARDMAASLMTSILKFRSAADVRELIRELGMSASDGGVLSVVMGLDSHSSSEEGYGESMPLARGLPSVSVPSRDVAHLVSAIGSAPEGPLRTAAVDELRRYRDKHGDDDLTSHLDNVSETFSEYIWEQLDLPVGSPSKAVSRDSFNLPMSARIRDLRSRLSVAEVAAPEVGHLPPEKPNPAVTPTRIPTPSRIPRGGAANSYLSTSALSLRERLAAAQASGLRATEQVEPSSDELHHLVHSSHAAALRARLQAVKRQSQSSAVKDIVDKLPGTHVDRDP